MKTVSWILILGLVLSLCGCSRANAFPSSTLTPTAFPAPDPIATVVLDAGHGGIDQGCVGENGSLEAELNLDIVLRLKDYLRDQAVECILTREDETVYYDPKDPRTRKNQDMVDRAETIQQSSPDAVISIHMNRYEDPSVNGPQIFYKADDEGSRTLALQVQTALSALPEVQKDRKIMESDNLYILNASPSPAILIECGFLSHAGEEALLMTQDYRQTLAETIGSQLIAWLTQYHAQGDDTHAVPGH